jgi:hypothetical protein
MKMENQISELGVDQIVRLEKTKIEKNKWVYSITYADRINGKKVWRTYPNYVSQTFKLKREAVQDMDETLLALHLCR